MRGNMGAEFGGGPAWARATDPSGARAHVSGSACSYARNIPVATAGLFWVWHLGSFARSLKKPQSHSSKLMIQNRNKLTLPGKGLAFRFGM